jgi:hypothetical protein
VEGGMGGGKTIRATKSTNINYNISDRKGPKMKGRLQEQKDKKKTRKDVYYTNQTTSDMLTEHYQSSGGGGSRGSRKP